VPLWIPLLLIATLTVFASWWVKRPLLGHCRICGYDLTGNVSGVCPEWEVAVPALPEDAESLVAN
jgi:hypothetical protein